MREPVFGNQPKKHRMACGSNAKPHQARSNASTQGVSAEKSVLSIYAAIKPRLRGRKRLGFSSRDQKNSPSPRKRRAVRAKSGIAELELVVGVCRYCLAGM